MANAASSGGRDPDAFLRGLFAAAIAAAAPAKTLARFLPPPPKGRTIVVGAGKAAASMAAAVEAAWRSPLEGLVVTRYGHGAPTQRVICPVALGFMSEFRVVAAWCEARAAFRHFRVDRIAALAITPERYPRRRRALLAQWRQAEGLEG